MARKETNQGGMAKQLKFVTLFPAGAGTCMAILIFLIQYWKWFQTGEWQGAPFAQYCSLSFLFSFRFSLPLLGFFAIDHLSFSNCSPPSS